MTVPISVMGRPKPQRFSPSHFERQNLTVRMQLHRFTRVTNAFSKKLSNMKAALALHFTHYNFIRVHSTLRVTPAMAAGITDHLRGFGNYWLDFLLWPPANGNRGPKTEVGNPLGCGAKWPHSRAQFHVASIVALRSHCKENCLCTSATSTIRGKIMFERSPC